MFIFDTPSGDWDESMLQKRNIKTYRNLAQFDQKFYDPLTTECPTRCQLLRCGTKGVEGRDRILGPQYREPSGLGV